MLRSTGLLLLLCVPPLAACGDDTTNPTDDGPTQTPVCDAAALGFEAGDPNGHPDPLGAAAAGQARAGRIDASQVPQPAHGRQKVRDGDFLLINDKIAVVIENADPSDGYGEFGGGVLSVDRVGSDGKPVGGSKFHETLQLTSIYMVDPTSVGVIADGSDGKAAIVRATGPLHGLPFLRDTFGAAFPQQYADLVAAYDYVLEPGEERVKVRFGIVNPTEFDVDTGVNFDGSFDLIGFFQWGFNDLFLPGRGFGTAGGTSYDWVGYENDAVPFAYVGPGGGPLDYGGIDIGGFTIFSGPGSVASACSADMVDNHEIVVGEDGGGIDGLGEVVRRVYERDAWREITGVVRDAEGAPVAGAYVHALDADDKYLSRVVTDEDGAFAVHAPKADVRLVPQKRGYPASDGLGIASSQSEADLDFDPNGFIHVRATELKSGSLMPVRIQVIPADVLPATPDSYGSLDEINGRLWQDFSIEGDSTLAVPVGTHRVVVSHGYEWELHDEEVVVDAGETVEVTAQLTHSVDTTGAISADFHIHSMYSADSNDPVVYKVKGALADGLDCPVSSEHEWVHDFQPIIEDLEMTDWAFGIPAEELTTFTWGHFGVVGIQPKPELRNNGGIPWLDRTAQEVFDEVHALPEEPIVIVNHPRGSSVFQAYFTAVDFNRETGSSDSELWSESFDAIEVFNESDFESNRDESVADWFALLNLGKVYFAVGDSDSHLLRDRPVGYPRNFLFVGYDDPKLGNADDVLDAVSSGHVTVGGGIFLDVVGPGNSTPGDRVTFPAGDADFTVTVRCPSWVSAETLETIVNGETISVDPLLPIGEGPGKEFVNTVTVTLPDGPRAWVIFHAKGADGTDLSPVHPGNRAFAVSNPILFER